MDILRVRSKETNEWRSIAAIKGDKPIKGVDYYTEADKQEIITDVQKDLKLDDYYTKEEADAATQDALTDYATVTYVDEAIANAPGGASTATDVSFDDTVAQIGVTNVQDAIEYLSDMAVDADTVQEQIDENIDDLSFNNLFGASITTSLPALESSHAATIEEAIKKGHIARNVSPLSTKITLANIIGKNYQNSAAHIGIVSSTGDITYTAEPASSTVTIPGYAFAVKINEKTILITDNQSYFVKALRKIAYDNTTSGLTATTLPDAIDELATKINSLVDVNEVSY